MNNLENQKIYKTYQTGYKNLPYIIFIINLLTSILFGFTEVFINAYNSQKCYFGILSFIVGNEPSSSAILAVVIWTFLGLIISIYLYYLTKILISQKIVITDATLSIYNELKVGLSIEKKPTRNSSDKKNKRFSTTPSEEQQAYVTTTCSCCGENLYFTEESIINNEDLRCPFCDKKIEIHK